MGQYINGQYVESTPEPITVVTVKDYAELRKEAYIANNVTTDRLVELNNEIAMATLIGDTAMYDAKLAEYHACLQVIADIKILYPKP